MPAPDRHDRPGVLPLDAVDLTQLFETWYDERVDRARPIAELIERTRRGRWRRRTATMGRADRRPSSGRPWMIAGWRTRPKPR